MHRHKNYQTMTNENTTSNKQQTKNRLFAAVNKTYTEDGQKYRIRVEIRLDDECKNGHEDFSVTADGYEVRPNGREIWAFGGCCHDTILKHFPQFADFVRLHLCDFSGVPMYAVENGFYHIKQGNRKAVENTLYCCTADEVTEAMTQADKDELYFKIWLEAKGIPARWQEAANKAIKELEQLDGGTFESQATKRHYTPPTDEERAIFDERQKSGYYTPEQCQARQTAKIDELIAKHLDYYEDKIQEAKRDKEIKAAACQAIKAMAGTDVEAFKRLYDGFSAYSYKDTICVRYDANKISTNERDEFCARLEADSVCAGNKFEVKARSY